jgi:hypothetical protein
VIPQTKSNHVRQQQGMEFTATNKQVLDNAGRMFCHVHNLILEKMYII